MAGKLLILWQIFNIIFNSMISFEDIRKAHQVVSPVVHRTPVLTSRSLDRETGLSIYFKCENFQRVGAFKIRGAYNKIASMTPEEKKRGVVAFSSGNHAQGVALASQLLGTTAKIVMPDNSPRAKLAATKAYGAEVIFYDFKEGNREAIGREIAEKEGRILVPPFNDERIIAGQGTIALEFSEQVSELDYVFLPVGGGGLIAGNAVAMKHLCPNVRIIGVETVPANDGQQSFRKGEIVSIAPPDTIADGMRTLALGDKTFPVIQKFVDDMVTVTDREVIEAMRWLFTRLKIVVEPTAAVPLAAVMKNESKIRNQHVGVVLTGGNVDMDEFFELLGKRAA